MQIVYALLGTSPQLTAAIVGLVVAGVFWRKMPRAAMLLLLASVLEMAVLAASGWYHMVYFPAALQAHDRTMVELTRNMAFVGFATSALHGLVFGLLVWAVATGRGRPVPPAVPGR
ncbi:hypothetical protein [Dyella amyloliquefaciens]|uniref:hypothetical protein n=1 Tax=Dyella amyloliquefaciens TaxID=1770545 RepID=UPI00102EB70C|nr:hypothetical protein [Dyella amyloliquefaciens]